MSEKRLSDYKRPAITLLVLLAAGGMAAEQVIRRRRKRPNTLAEDFDLEAYRERLKFFKSEDVSAHTNDMASIVAGVVFAETDVYAGDVKGAKAAMTESTISDLIAANDLIQFHDDDLDLALRRLVEHDLLIKGGNPRATTVDDHPVAYYTNVFVPEGGPIKPEFASLFYQTVRQIDPQPSDNS